MYRDKLISYDLFGTLIDWKSGNSDGVICLLQDRLEKTKTLNLDTQFVTQFCLYRKQAVNLARNTYIKAGVEEISLAQIYQAIQLNGFISKEQMHQIYNMELSLRKEQLYLMEQGMEHLKQDLSSGTPAIIVADSILGASILKPWLHDLDPIFDKLRFCLSADYKKCASRGTLFSLLRDERKWKDLEGWKHKSASDYPCEVWLKKAGLKFEKLHYNQLPKLEKDLLCKFPFDGTLQLCTGISKKLLQQSDKISVAKSTGRSIGGTLLTVYVHWVLQISVNKGIKRLYFIARDGYILKQMADVMIQAWKLPIETYYIYGSRKAWRMPSFDGTEEALRLIVLYSNANNLRALSSALGIEADVLQSYFAGVNIDEKFSNAGRNAVARRLCRDESFRHLLREKHQVQRESMKAYLQQEIDTSDEFFAFVEINGTGFTQQCLSTCMQLFYNHPIRTFYFNIYRMWPENPMCQYMVFLPGPIKNSLILEPLTRALHGTTEKYECRDGKWVPVLPEDGGHLLSDYKYDEYIEGCLNFCQVYSEYAQIQDRINLLSIVSYIENISEYMQEDVFKYIADMPYNHFGRKNTISAYAPLLSKDDVRNIFLLHRSDVWEEYYHGADLEMSISRCSKAIQKKVFFYRKKANKVIERFSTLWGHNLVPERKKVGLLQDFPVSILGKRFVVYGAGIYGTRLHAYIKEQSGIEIVGWVDKNYKEKQSQGLPVTGDASSLMNLKFDILFLAIVKREWAYQAKHELLSMGIEEKKIYDFFNENDYLI